MTAGRVYQVSPNVDIPLLSKGQIRLTANRVYRVTTEVRQLTAPTDNSANVFTLGIWGLDASYNSLAYTGVTAPVNSYLQSPASVKVADGWVKIAADITIGTNNTAVWGRTYLKIAANSGSVVQVISLTIEDVTESQRAKGSADAAAVSASNASASDSAAGLKAQAALNSATQASTSRDTATTAAGQASISAGNASTSASQASQSETNAAGSASSAGTSATNAAQSSINASDSASAAATSASTATTKATEAGNSATAANNSALDASSSFSNAALVVTKLFPDRYDAVGKLYFTFNPTGDPKTVPDAPSNAIAANYGSVREIVAANNVTVDFATRNVLPATAGKIYRVEVEFQRTALTGSPATVNLYLLGMDSSYGYLGVVGSPTDALTGAVQTTTLMFSNAASSGVTAWTGGSVWLRPFVHVVGVAGANSTTVQIRRLTITDVTSEMAATNSASAAALSASNASTQATNAGASATSATNASNTATSQAGTATTQAGIATTAATNAGTAATNAGLSAGSAQTVANNLLPDRPSVRSNFASTTAAPSPETVTPLAYGTIVPVANEGDVLQNNTTGYVITRGWIGITPSRVYQQDVRWAVTTDGAGSVTASWFLYNSAQTYLGAINIPLDASLTAAEGWRTFTNQVATATLLAAYPTAAYVRAGVYFNTSLTWQINILRLRDVTDTVIAQNAASAASTSASNADTSATAAGQSASASNQSATLAATSANNASLSEGNANTYSGQAATFASNASKSASDASGSANTASIQAGVASTSVSTIIGTINTAPILPSDFRNGLTSWTNARSGSPTTIAPATTTYASGTSVITNDPDFGSAYQSNWSSAGQNILPVGVIPATAGRVYEIIAKFKLSSLPTDGSAAFQLAIFNLIADYSPTSSIVVYGPVVNVTTTGVNELHLKVSDATSNGADIAWTADTKFFRPALRLNSTETSMTIRIGSLQVVDVTEKLAAQAAANLASTQASAAAGSASTASTQAGLAGTSANSATNSSNTASTAAGAATAAQTAAQAIADKLFPKEINPQTLPSFSYSNGMVLSAPGTGWPTPYLFTSSDAAEKYIQHKAMHSKIVGQRMRLTFWVFSYSDKARVAIGLNQTNNSDGTGQTGAIVSNYLVPDGCYSPDATSFPTNQFLKFGYEWTVTTDTGAFIIPYIYINSRAGGTPTTGNDTVHLAGFIWEDITSEFAAKNSASAAATSASNASASNTAAGQQATAAQQSATNANTYAGSAQTYAGQASTSASNAAGSANSASSSSGVAATARDTAISTAAQILPNGFTPNEQLFWTEDETNYSPTTTYDSSFFGPAAYPVFVTKAGQSRVVSTRGTFVPIAGRRYRISVEIAQTTNITNGRPSIFFYGLTRAGNNGTVDQSVMQGVDTVVSLPFQTFTTFSFDWVADSNLWWARPRIHTNWDRAGTSFSDAIFQIRKLGVIDVTEAYNAGLSASAAAASASNASASNTAAGQQAAAALSQATNAQTYAGQANTSANNASTSASNALGSANSASSSASVSATARDTAQTLANTAQTIANNLFPKELTPTTLSSFIYNSDGYLAGPDSTWPASYMMTFDNGVGNARTLQHKVMHPKIVGQRMRTTFYVWTASPNARVAVGVNMTDNADGSGAVGLAADNGVVPAGCYGDTTNVPTQQFLKFGYEWTVSNATKAFIAPYAYVNPIETGTNSPNGYRTHITAFVWEDVTNQYNASLSATAAATSASNASASNTAAGQSATSAQQSATNASTSAGNANTYANNASTSANNAAGSANSASSSAGVSATAKDSAIKASAQLLTNTFGVSDQLFWIEDEVNYNASNLYDSTFFGPVDYPVFVTKPGQSRVVAARGTFIPVAGRRYRISLEIARVASITNGRPSILYVGLTRAGTNGNVDQTVMLGIDSSISLTPNNWTTFYLDWIADSNLWWARPRLHWNWDNAGTSYSDAIYHIRKLGVTDVTDAYNAGLSASAAATSASNASAAQTAAGQSATSAQQSATNASTSAGNANTYANNASTSASNAAGSANNASSSAGVSATARDAAQTAQSSAQAIADRLYPKEITPTTVSSFTISGAYSFGGPDRSWPQPYLLTFNDSSPHYTHHKATHPKIVGQRMRLTFWVFTYSPNCRVAVYFGQSNSSDLSSGGSGYTPANGAVPTGCIGSDNTGFPTQQFLKMGWEGTIGADAQAFIYPEIYVNSSESGTPSNNLTHICGFIWEDVTSEYASLLSANASATSASNASASNTAAGQNASSAQQSATNANTSAGQASTSANNASTSAYNALGSANSASSSASVSATARDTAQTLADSLFPRELTPSTVSSFRYTSDGYLVGPDNSWPASYMMTFDNGVGNARTLQHATMHPKIVGQRMRITFYVWTASPYARVAVGVSMTNNADGSGQVGLAADNAIVPDGCFGDSSTVPTNQFLKFGYEFTVSNATASFIIPYAFVNPSQTGTTSNYRTHITAFVYQDVTSEYASKQSASAAATSASNASASNTAAGQQASAAQQSATNANTYAGQASTSANNASTSASNALGSANSASSSAGVSATARDASISARDAGLATLALQFPPSLDPKSRSAWNLEGNGSVQGPSGSWPNPYAWYTTPDTNPQIAVIGNSGIPCVVGERYRITGWVYTDATNAYVFAFGGGNNTQNNWYDGTTTTTNAINYTTPNGCIGSATAIPRGGWYKVGVEYTINGTTPLFHRPVIVINSSGNGNVNAGAYISAPTFEKITSEAASKGFADASSTSASQASASNSAAGNSASAANQSRIDAQAANGSAQSAASNAQTFASNASASAASASSSATLSATINSTSPAINRNSKFQAWPDGAFSPTAWNLWSLNGGSINRGTSRQSGGYAATMNSTASANLGLFNPIYLLPGWHVLSATVWLQSGTWRGAGVYVDGQTQVNFATDRDTANSTGPTGLGIRTFTKLINVTGNIGDVNIYAMTNWEGFGQPQEIKLMQWMECSIRPASDPEVQAQAATQNISSLTATVNNTSSAVATLQSQSATVEQRLLAGQPNLLINSTFESGYTNWNLSTPPGTSVYTGLTGAWGYAFSGAGNYTGGPYGMLQSGRIPVYANTSYTVSADTMLFSNTSASYCYFDVLFVDGNGNIVAGGDGGQNQMSASQDFSSSASKRLTYAHTDVAPSGSVYAVIRFIVDAGGGTVTNFGIRRIKFELGSTMSAYTAEASAAYQAGVLSDHSGKLSSYLALSTSAGAAAASLKLVATDGAGNTYSGVAIEAQEFVVTNNVGGNKQVAMSIVNGSATFSGSLNVGADSGGNRLKITNQNITVFDGNGTRRVAFGLNF